MRGPDGADRYWTTDRLNHAVPRGRDVGVEALRGYHEQFTAQLSPFSDTMIDAIRQVGEADRVVTQLVTRGTHAADFAATGNAVTLDIIRIDRLEAGRIAEHWSVADIAVLVQRLHP